MNILDNVVDLVRKDMLLEAVEDVQACYDYHMRVNGFCIHTRCGSVISLNPFTGDFTVDGVDPVAETLCEEILDYITAVTL